jgi:hypothetical protein
MTRLPERWFFARVRNAWLAMLIVAAVPAVCSAQAASASTLKAAFTLNFLKFTEWPDLKPGQPILVCVSGDRLRMRSSKPRAGWSTTAQSVRIAPGGAVRDCNLLLDRAKVVTFLEEARQFLIPP